METTGLTCQRHPETPTRLRCSECGAAICAKCSVDTAVGQKCPACAKQKRAAVSQGKPRQYVKGVAVGLAAAAGLAFVLQFVLGGFGSVIGTGLAGFGLGRAVAWGAEGNRADPFRNVTIGLALLMTLAAYWLSPFTLIPGFFGALPYLAGGYGAWLAFNR